MRKLLAIFFCYILLCTTAEATVTVNGGNTTIASEQITTVAAPYSKMYSLQTDTICGTYTSTGQTFSHECGDIYNARYSTYYSYMYEIAGRTFNSSFDVQTATGTFSYSAFNEAKAAPYAIRCTHVFSSGSRCNARGYSVAVSNLSSVAASQSGSWKSAGRRAFSGTVTLKSCNFSGHTSRLPSLEFACVINGGDYKGYPALRNTSIVVNKGTITDYGNSHSTFMLGEDSEQTVSQGSSDTTITTVKLSNPPVIIDWADFPG